MSLPFEISVLAITVSAILCAMIRAFHARLQPSASSGRAGSKPQNIHHLATPRIGGVAIGAALLAAAAFHGDAQALMLSGAGLIALLAGLAEDLTHRVSPLARYLAALLAAAIACVWGGARIVRLDVTWLDPAMASWPLSLGLTVFAIASFAHAVNLTDGLNGLAAGLMIMSLMAVARVADGVGDHALVTSSGLLASALLGFFVFNFPMGRIFLGDGGAYFSGMLVAVLTILLVQRNPSVSAWFALAVLAHPVVETLLTVLRRSLLHQSPIGQPDRLHLHSLLYRRLLQGRPDAAVRCNAGAASVLLLSNAVMAGLAVMHWQQTGWLMTQSGLYALTFALTWRYLMKTDPKNLP